MDEKEVCLLDSSRPPVGQAHSFLQKHTAVSDTGRQTKLTSHILVAPEYCSYKPAQDEGASEDTTGSG